MQEEGELEIKKLYRKEAREIDRHIARLYAG